MNTIRKLKERERRRQRLRKQLERERERKEETTGERAAASETGIEWLVGQEYSQNPKLE
jgi:hypothetical protein